MSITGFFRFLSALMVAIALLAGGSFFVVQYLIAQYSVAPPKPRFPNDKSEKAAKPTPAAKASPTPKPSPTVSVAKGYRATVTQEIGLNIREAPEPDAPRIGGVDYKDEVLVLEESADKNWQKIRLSEDNIEGWVKAGYTERIN
jgi:Bacterial SH3 domain